MSYKVNFYTFTKRLNSTKVPTGTGVEFDCIVKTETGIVNPIVTLVQIPTFSPTYNFCKIPAFNNRWYWVREWQFSDRAWTAYLESDVLASFKSTIGSSSHYVLRSASQSNGNIIDTHYPTKTNITEISGTPTDTTAWWNMSKAMTSGRYVVGVRGLVQTGQASGTTTYLLLTASDFKTFTQAVFDSQMTDYISGTFDITDTLAKMIFDPTKYIASCMWVPGTPTGDSQSTGINVGWWKFNGTYNICAPSTYISFTPKVYALADHPQKSGRGAYLNVPPFTYRMVWLPRYGLVDLSDKLPSNAGAIKIELSVDPISGEGFYRIFWKETTTSTYDYLLDEIQAQIGVEIPLTSTLMSMGSVASSLSSVGNAAINLLTGNILGVAGDIASFYSAFSPHLETIGKHSGFLGYSTNLNYPILYNKFISVVDDDNTENGRPLCEVKTINTLSGYVQVLHGDMEISGATIGELEKVKEYLEGGFFYE